MRFNHWSSSEFSNTVRKLFGIPPEPTSASFEGWGTYRDSSKSKSPIGYWVVEHLDTVQDVVMFIPDKFRSLLNFISNASGKTHVLKTRVGYGKWGDLVEKLPDALMFSIINFVETECFYAYREYTHDEANKFAQQNKFMRTFFPAKVSDTLRGEYGIKWMEFQIDSHKRMMGEYGGAEDTEEHAYHKIIRAYLFAKNEYFKFDPWALVDYDFDADRTPMFKLSVERSAAYEQITKLETEFDEKVTEHCSNIIKYRGHLWT
jgi:hypothetical protein